MDHPLIKASRDGDLNGVHLSIGDGTSAEIKNEALFRAAGEGHTEIVTALIAAGADVNAENKSFHLTPLAGAARRGQAEVAKVLIAAGAKDLGGALLWAAGERPSVEVVRALIAAGADVNVSRDYPPGCQGESDVSPLFGVINKAWEDRDTDHGQAWIDVAEVLIGAKANVNVREEYGDTPLIRAVRVVSERLVSALISAGADVNAVGSLKKTPLREANGYPNIVSLLKAAGAER